MNAHPIIRTLRAIGIPPGCYLDDGPLLPSVDDEVSLRIWRVTALGAPYRYAVMTFNGDELRRASKDSPSYLVALVEERYERALSVLAKEPLPTFRIRTRGRRRLEAKP